MKTLETNSDELIAQCDNDNERIIVYAILMHVALSKNKIYEAAGFQKKYEEIGENLFGKRIVKKVLSPLKSPIEAMIDQATGFNKVT